MALTVDRRAVLAGARLAVLVGAGAIAVAQAITSLTDGDANLPLYLVLLGGLGAGGRLAALRQPTSPLTHGALAAIAAYVVLIVVITLIRLALGKEVADPVSLAVQRPYGRLGRHVRRVPGPPPPRTQRMSVLVIDVGTSSVRGSIVRPDATVANIHRRTVLPSTPAPGFVELDAAAIAAAVLEVAQRSTGRRRPGRRRGHHQPALDHRSCGTGCTGEPVGPGIGWQDQRTVMMCLALQAQGLRLSPSSSATKLAFLLDTHDPDRPRDLCFGTVDTWVAWTLSAGSLHVTDLPTPASPVSCAWTAPAGTTPSSTPFASRRRCMPQIVDSSGGRSARPSPFRASPAHRRPGRRPAGFAHRPGLHAPPAWPR